MVNMGHLPRIEMGEKIKSPEELAYQHLIAQLQKENQMLKDELASLRKLLTKQNQKRYVRKPQ